MSRSIHTTRKELEQLRQSHYADKRAYREELERVEETLDTKRRIKHSQPSRLPDVIYTEIETIPIVVVDTEAYLHYPTSPDDLRAVMRLLPRGTVDGLQGIEYRLGIVEDDDEKEHDPYLGVFSDTILPDTYCSAVRGQYAISRRMIKLHGFVYDADAMPDRPMWELYLRFLILETFMHEMAHHVDNAQRKARRRWRADQREKNEWYAEREAHRWVHEIVIPYLECRYPEQVRQFHDWLREYGGIPLMLAGVPCDPPTLREGQRIDKAAQLLCPLTSAIERLAESVRAGKSRRETRLEFADNLHLSDEFELALEVIDLVLSEHPGDLDALTRQADVLAHLKRYDEAERIALGVLEHAPDRADTLWVLVHVNQDQKRGQPLLALVDRLLRLEEQGAMRPLLIPRAYARLWVGDVAGFCDDLRALLPSGKQRTPFFVKDLLKEARTVLGPDWQPPL